MDSREIELWGAYQEDRSIENRNALVEHYLSLAHRIAASVYWRHARDADLEDCKSAAYVGLIDAIERFEPQRGNQFATYAGYRIVGSVIDQLRKGGDIPRRNQEHRVVFSLDAVIQTHQSIDGQGGGRDDVKSVVWEDLTQEDPIDILSHRELPGLLPLGVKAREVMKLYYSDCLTMREVGNRLGICESRVSQIHKQALEELRELRAGGKG